MGQEIVYCAKCGTRIKESDFKEKKAFAISNRNWCLECIEKMLPSLSETGRARMQELMRRESEPAKASEPESGSAEPQAVPKAGTSKILKSEVIRRLPRDVHLAADRGEPRSSVGGKTALIVGSAVLALSALIAGVILIGGGAAKRTGGASREPPLAAPPREPAPTSSTPGIGDEPSNPDRRPTRIVRATQEEICARVDALIAEAFRDPSQPPGPILNRMRDLRWEADLYPEMVKALNEAMAPFEKKLKEEVDIAAATVAKEADALAAQTRYGEAFTLLDERKRARPEPEWTSAIDRLILDLRGRVDKEWEELARRAKQAFDPKDARTILEPIRGWGVDMYARKAEALLKELEQAVAAVLPVTAPDSKPKAGSDPTPVAPADDAKAYESLWMQAADHALKREYDAALRAVATQAGSLIDAETRRKALEDQRAFTLAKEMFDQAIEFLASGAGGSDVTLRFVDPIGRKSSVRGKVVRASTIRVELQGSGQSTEFVEISEVEADSLYTLHRARKSKEELDAERAAYFFIFEGDPKSGRKVAGKFAEKIPARFWEYAEALAERLREARKSLPLNRDAAKREMEARELFYKAERAYRNVDQAALAVTNFKEVLSRYGDTEFVRRNRAQIETRADGGKEWLVRPSDIKAASPLWELKRLPGAPLDKVWLAKSDSTPENYRQSWIEVSFYTAPGATYRIYVFAYGCCQETLKFFYQGNGVVASGGQSAEIGAPTSIVVPAPTSLPATHGHGGGQHKWDWILFTQGYNSGGGGVKKFRIMTEIGDVGIGYILVTSTRTALPRNVEELRQLEWGL